MNQKQEIIVNPALVSTQLTCFPDVAYPRCVWNRCWQSLEERIKHHLDFGPSRRFWPKPKICSNIFCWKFSASLLLDTFTKSEFRLSNMQCITRNTKNKTIWEHMQTHPHTHTAAVGKEWRPDFSPLLHTWRWAARSRWSQCGAPSNTHIYMELSERSQTDGEEHSPLFTIMRLTLYREKQKRPRIALRSLSDFDMMLIINKLFNSL